MTKFILGSAQFGSKYGINQSHTDKTEIKNFKNLSKK